MIGSLHFATSGITRARSIARSLQLRSGAFYSIVLSIPANTTIAAHSHRDNRVATVVSGTWRIGYGEQFSEQALKVLPPGSVYSEPAGGAHFARTINEPVLVQISGFGPTDTHYVNPADEPKVKTGR
jgi:uncharacterized RmlC-like cupin family protein